MKNRGTFGGGNGGLWMIRKRRKVTTGNNNEEGDDEEFNNTKKARQHDDKPLAFPGGETTGHIHSNSGQNVDTESFFQLDQDADEALSPVKISAPKIVIATTHRKNNKSARKRNNWGVKRGTFGSRQRNLLTDSEISKKIRVALSQSSVSQVSSSDGDEEDQTSPQRRKLVVDSSDDDEDSSIASKQLQNEDNAFSSQASLNSNLTFQDDKNEPSRNYSSNRAELHPSLAAARSFFAELDNVPLTMEDAGRNPSAKKSYKLRTRRCKLPEQALRSEYAKYCAACGESGVKPLSIQHFAEQRARYFRQWEVFEGMFDE
jgi:hypothetical protein